MLNTQQESYCKKTVVLGGAVLLACAGLVLNLNKIGDGDCDGGDELTIKALGTVLAFTAGSLSTLAWKNGYMQGVTNKIGSFFHKNPAVSIAEHNTPAELATLEVVRPR